MGNAADLPLGPPPVSIFKRLSRPAETSIDAVAHARYTTPSRDRMLRRVQEEEALRDQIWQLALAEAYGNNNQAWFQKMAGCTKPEIIGDYLQRHPSMARFLESHVATGTCGDALGALEAERVRRRNDRNGGPSQMAVTAWMLKYYETAYRAGKPPPKRTEEAFQDCRADIQATDAQMRIALKSIPSDRKRQRGRQIAG